MVAPPDRRGASLPSSTKVISVADVSHLLADAIGMTVRGRDLADGQAVQRLRRRGRRTARHREAGRRPPAARSAASAASYGTRPRRRRRDAGRACHRHDRRARTPVATARRHRDRGRRRDAQVSVMDSTIMSTLRSAWSSCTSRSSPSIDVLHALPVELLLDRRELLHGPATRVVLHHPGPVNHGRRRRRQRRWRDQADAAACRHAGKPIAFVCAMPMELDAADARARPRRVRRRRAWPCRPAGWGSATSSASSPGWARGWPPQNVERLLDAFDVDHLFVVGIAGAGMSDAPIGALGDAGDRDPRTQRAGAPPDAAR